MGRAALSKAQILQSIQDFLEQESSPAKPRQCRRCGTAMQFVDAHFLLRGTAKELEYLFARLPDLRPGDTGESASPGDHPLTSNEHVRIPSRLRGDLKRCLGSDGRGNHIYNEILRELPRPEFAIVSPKLELVRLQPRQVLHEASDTLKFRIFLQHGPHLHTQRVVRRQDRGSWPGGQGGSGRAAADCRFPHFGYPLRSSN